MESKEKKEILFLSESEIDVATIVLIKIEDDFVEVKRKIEIYLNTKDGVDELLKNEPENIYNVAVAYWGGANEEVTE